MRAENRIVCSTCDGRGYPEHWPSIKCERCVGSGWIDARDKNDYRPLWHRAMDRASSCKICNN